MRASTRRAGAALLFAASLSLTGSPALADELLVMPYACTMVGGRPLLTRAPEQSHRIIGHREQRTYSACSPANPEMCRNWTIHRFDLDCEGARVPWITVIASIAEETTRRAWVEGGKLVMRMPPAWGFERDDPCARPSSFDDRFGFGRMRRYCADRRAMAPPPIVELPAGFAPMLGFDGIFVKAGPNQAAPPPLPPVAEAPSAPPPKVARAEPPQRVDIAPAPAPALRPEPQAETASKDTPAPKSAPSAPPKVALQATPAPAQPAPAPVAKAPPPAPVALPADTPGGPVIPRIINRPEAATTDVSEQTRTSSATAPKTASPSPEAARAPTPQSPTPKAGTEPESSTITVGLMSVVRSPTVGIAAFGGLALVLLAAFALARRRERLAGSQARDIASVSLGGRRSRGQLVPHTGAARQGPPAPVPTQPPAPAPVQAAAAGPAWADRIPQTRSEALQMLGMGVSRDATETAMKKIVDGLRLSWHPDLAKDETDRRLREFRLKQINAAWDLIQGKRLERLDS